MRRSCSRCAGESADEGKCSACAGRPLLRSAAASRRRAAAAAWPVHDLDAMPDISSRLAWLDGNRIVDESAARRLTLLGLDGGGAVESGTAGSWPAAAADAGEWFAVVGGQVLRFPVDRPFAAAPTLPDGYTFGTVSTLRLTRDGQVCAWTEPTLLYASRGYVQQRGQRRRRFPQPDSGTGIVIGPIAGPDGRTP